MRSDNLCDTRRRQAAKKDEAILLYACCHCEGRNSGTFIIKLDFLTLKFERVSLNKEPLRCHHQNLKKTCCGLLNDVAGRTLEDDYDTKCTTYSKVSIP